MNGAKCNMNEKITTNNSINNFCAIFLAVTSIINCLHFIFPYVRYRLLEGKKCTNNVRQKGTDLMMK